MDFTIKKYEELCKAISNSDYKNITLEEYLQSPPKNKFVILRHDVDERSKNTLKIAKIENKYGLKSTFYFRIKTFDYKLMKKIKKLGHEIGYHYECLDEAKGNYNEAIKIFEKNLQKFKNFDVKTICMHGNVLTKWNNRDLWKKYNFRKFGVIGEAYLSINFSELEYFSDTGRTWHHSKYNIKDIPGNYNPNVNIKTTDELIELVKEEKINLYILVHPDKWNDNIFAWLKELIFQNIKNVGKLFLKWFYGNKKRNK